MKTPRIRVIALAAAMVVAFVLSVLPAAADTLNVTFQVTSSGTLSVSAATGSVDLGSFDATAGDGAGALPEVTVADNRNPFLGTWNVTVDATSFETTDGTNTYTIPGAAVSYWSGVATAGFGDTVVVTGQQPLQANAVTLASQRTAVTATGAVGNNTATFTPSISVDLSGVASGTYNGDIVHSVTGG